MTWDMTPIVEVPPAERGGVLPEEIEVTIEEHADLVKEAKGGPEFSADNDLNQIFLDSDVWFEDPADDEGSANKEDLFVNLRAEEQPPKQKSVQKTSKLPPAITLATTFDTEPTSSVSGDESSTASADVIIQELMSDFSSLSALEVSAIMEEQKKGQDLSKVEEIQEEQDQIDKALELLVEEEDGDDDSEMVPDVALDLFNNHEDANLEKGDEHAEDKVANTSTSDEKTTDTVDEFFEEAPMDEIQGHLSKSTKSKHKQANGRGYFGLFNLFVIATATTSLVAVGYYNNSQFTL